jgi:hypothetical protein
MDTAPKIDDAPCKECIEQYKSYLQDVGNIGTRHENSRRFYLSVVSALFVFLSMAGKDGVLHVVDGPVRVLVGVFGILLCVVWIMHMQSFAAIYLAKFSVLRAMEVKCRLFRVFEEEWNCLKVDPRYKFLTLMDSAIPILFVVLFLALLYFRSLPQTVA